MGLYRYLRRKLNTQQIKEISEAILSKVGQTVDSQKELGWKTDQAIAGLQEFGKKTDQVLVGQQEISRKSEQAINGLQDIVRKIDQIIASQEETQKKVDSALQSVQQSKSDLQKAIQSLEQIRRASIDSSRYSSESVWGELFNQVSDGSTWLKDRRFAAGRWAVGYQYLYAVYRILNEVRPKNILELGLGQSTKLISQYAAANPDVHHQVVEHDPDWIDFFSQNYKLPSNTEMVRLVWDFIPYKDAERVRVFKDFSQTFKGSKFDFISIDAPFGGDMKQYARIDVLRMLPECLSDSFIIIIDDAERSGETHTVIEMAEVLKSAHIPFSTGRYSGKKDCMIICSQNLKFVCSM